MARLTWDEANDPSNENYDAAGKLGVLISGKNPDGTDFTLPISGSVTTTESRTSSATNGKTAVGTSSTSVLASNANRKELTVVNDSANTIYLSLSGTAVLNEGIRLNANGGSYTNTNYTGAVTAISSVADSNLTTLEV